MKISFEFLANLSIGMILDTITVTINNSSEEGVKFASQADFDSW